MWKLGEAWHRWLLSHEVSDHWQCTSYKCSPYSKSSNWSMGGSSSSLSTSCPMGVSILRTTSSLPSLGGGGGKGTEADIRSGCRGSARPDGSLSPTNRRWSKRLHGYQATWYNEKCSECARTWAMPWSHAPAGARHRAFTEGHQVLHRVAHEGPAASAARHPRHHTGRKPPARAVTHSHWVFSQIKQQCLRNGQMLWVPVKGGWALQHPGHPRRALKAGKGGQRKRDKKPKSPPHAPEVAAPVALGSTWT